MHRRSLLLGAALGLGSGIKGAWALDLGQRDAAAGIRTALERGAVSAVSLLGRTDGFLGNPKVRIPLPDVLEQAAGVLRMLGQQQRVDSLVTAMNRAAEQAVPEAKDMLVRAARAITVNDAVHIVQGGETSVTDYFAAKTREPLHGRFLPIVTRATQKVDLAEKYDAFAGRAAGVGLIRAEDANLERYVTARALDGLYLMIGEEEKKIRRDPVGTGSAILEKVFGALQH